MFEPVFCLLVLEFSMRNKCQYVSAYLWMHMLHHEGQPAAS